jgi:NitT/TauT family transport system ATP-binding protein
MTSSTPTPAPAPEPLHVNLALESRAVSHWFGPKRVLSDVNLKIRRGQFLSLVGPSGCGKSTLLRAIVGTHLPTQGEILLYPSTPTNTNTPSSSSSSSASSSITNPPIPKPIQGPGRDRGIVYQRYSLFPFLTARENVTIGLDLDRTSFPFRIFQYPKWRKLRKQHLQLAEEYLLKVKLADAMNCYPHELSGGMCQRVAIAQALIMQPEIILLDEPFGALDEATREDLQQLLLGLYAENQTALAKDEKPPHTLMIVTHELNEAIYVGDRVVGLSQYWDWKSEGHATCPGATVVYDKSAPVFSLKDTRDFELFADQRHEILRVVFDPQKLEPRNRYVQYWSQPTTTKAP